ncbi:MAG: hypothetical protein EAZ60_11925 [Oscillatoriales cyanobacterium]|nr:MAG: hypothetical protein EAZ83_01715 [Oscillatoriales cyanobacterium]TAF23409.1 MAG: hypothetical protein EAZ73_02055 [Oscillatoriales cyanobacterium]TAF30443.1 MAG: hypothetical protein EAZ69_22505 [Oscillatoriales cyanobacterium]TAF55793.1 MAG: hypothetical protein EAZ60_11925 [Oscillatoriales cyanobacterium]
MGNFYQSAIGNRNSQFSILKVQVALAVTENHPEKWNQPLFCDGLCLLCELLILFGKLLPHSHIQIRKRNSVLGKSV